MNHFPNYSHTKKFKEDSKKQKKWLQVRYLDKLYILQFAHLKKLIHLQKQTNIYFRVREINKNSLAKITKQLE